jgi:hypothetical protein
MAARPRARYEDFAVRLGGDGRGGFVAAVHRAPSGSGGSAPFVPPFPAAELPGLLAGLERAVRGSGPGKPPEPPTPSHATPGPAPPPPPRHLRPAAEAPPARDPKTIGEALTAALFVGPVRDAYIASLARLDPDDREGIRLRLVFDLGEPGTTALAALPWELLRDPAGTGFFGLQAGRPVVRSLALPGPAQHLTDLEPPLRVLLVSAAPADSPALDLAREARRIHRALSGTRGVSVEWLPSATVARLCERVLLARFDVLHFMGHAEFGEREGEGVLCFEAGDDDEPAALSGAQLGYRLAAGRGGPRLLVLNACDTARLPRRRGLDPYSGVAAALVRSGAPAVVAMQFPISDAAAARFSLGLYRALAAGAPVDAAVVAGRQEIDLGSRGSHEWATPVLFLRTAEGDVLRLRRGLTQQRRLLAAAGGAAIAAVLGALLYLPSLVSPPEPRPYRRPDVPPVAECPPPPDLPHLVFVRVEPGRLTLAPEPGEPPREIVVDRPFCMSAFETTQGQWNAAVGAEGNPSRYAGDDLPVDGVIFDEARAFVRRLNERAGSPRFRLPTDAEWEYAARAGTTTAYSFGDDPAHLFEHGNCLGREGTGDGFEATAPVGSFAPNPWGLYDVHGNVWEWVEAGAGSAGAADPETGRPRRIKHGGSYENQPDRCRSDARLEADPDRRDSANGFRIVQEPG